MGQRGPKKGERFGGRQKGTPNRNTTELAEIMQRLECHPFEVLLMFAKGDYKGLGYEKERVVGVTDGGDEITVLTISPELRQKSAKDACEYLFPKRKAIEHTGKDGEKLFSYEDYLKSLK